MTTHNARIGLRYMKQSSNKPTASDIAIISKIVGEFVNRSRQDIQDWRAAIEAADDPENPRWAQLQDLFEYLMPDGDLGSAIELRKGVTEANKSIVRDRSTGEEVREKTELLEKEWFFDFLGDSLDFIILAYTVIQVTDPIAGHYDVIPRRNFIPQKRMILLEAYGDKGISIDDPAIKDSIIYIRNQHKFGILNDIVPDLIWKKNARQAWAEFGEKFGLPLMTATTNKSNPADIAKIDTMLSQLGQAARAVFPEGTVLDVNNDAKSGDPYNVFLKQMEYSDGQIAKRILGGTMINADGSSRSQSEVHERNLNYIIGEKDRRKMEFVINNQLFPILRAAGIPLGANDQFVFDRSEDLKLSAHWAIVSGFLDKGFNVPEKWLSETFNIPIEGRDKPQATSLAPTTTSVSPKQEGAKSFFD